MRTRTKPRLVWVRYNPRTPLLALVGISLQSEVAHRRLCDYVWSGTPWPNPDCPKTAALALVPPADWDAVMAELRSVGWRTRNGRLYHDEVASVLRDSHDHIAANFARTQAANAARKAASTAPDEPASRATSRQTSHPSNTVSKQNITVPDITVNQAERLTLSSEPPKQGDNREKEFMGEIHSAIKRHSPKSATAEMTNWGGWWRNRYRENPDKAKRVLAELRSMINEGRITRNPGAAGLDLWNRLP